MTPRPFAFRTESTRAIAHGFIAQLVGCVAALQLASRTTLPGLAVLCIAAALALLAVTLTLRFRHPRPPDLFPRAIAHTLFGGGFLGFVFCVAILAAPDGIDAFSYLALYAVAFGSATMLGYALLRFVLQRDQPSG
jgi:hypothetical protein